MTRNGECIAFLEHANVGGLQKMRLFHIWKLQIEYQMRCCLDVALKSPTKVQATQCEGALN